MIPLAPRRLPGRRHQAAPQNPQSKRHNSPFKSRFHLFSLSLLRCRESEHSRLVTSRFSLSTLPFIVLFVFFFFHQSRFSTSLKSVENLGKPPKNPSIDWLCSFVWLTFLSEPTVIDFSKCVSAANSLHKLPHTSPTGGALTHLREITASLSLASLLPSFNLCFAFVFASSSLLTAAL